MHPHKNGESCQDCLGAALVSAGNDVDTISSSSFDVSSPREAFQLPCDSIRQASRHIGNHAQIAAPPNGISLNELATRVCRLLHVREPVQITDSLESGLYKLARRLPIAGRLVVQVARNEASWTEFEALKRLFEGSHEYLAAVEPSLLPSTIVSEAQSPGDPSGPPYACIDPTNEMVQVFGHSGEFPEDRSSHRHPATEAPSFLGPQGLHSDDNIASPCGGRLDDHHNVLPAEDSGYGSIAENVFVFVPRPKEGAGNTVEVNEDESETPYSIATNEDPAVTRGFVDELARDIYGRLKPMMDPDDWPLISESLLKLLKAFAITIGSDGASQANPDVMYFIHKQHRNIARQVRNLLLCQDDDPETHSRVDTEMDTMSLLDKMDMWDQKLSIEESRPKSPELFQNVIDDEFNIDVSFMDNKMILDSKDYDCFIQSLKTELLLDRYETDPSGSDMAIRQQILSTLPAGKISKRRRPKNHFVVFRFPTPSSACLMNDRVVVTSSSRNLQLTRISTYVDQTWPLLGRQVLRLVLFQGSKFQDRTFGMTSDLVHLAKNTQAFVTFGESYSSVSLIGSAYSAGEVGELLAWLAAATSDMPSSNDGHHVIVTTPSITKLGNFIEYFPSVPWPDSLLSLITTSSFESSAELEIRVTRDKTHLREQPQSLWDRLLGHSHGPPVIEGYPTIRRPQGCLGLELSYDLLQDARTTGFGHGGHLQESFLRLVLAGRANGVFYWHEPHFCGCSTKGFLKTHGDDIFEKLPEDVLKDSRHVICDCELYMGKGDEEASLAPSSTSIYSLDGGVLSMSSDSINVDRPNNHGFGFEFFKDLLRHIVQRYLSQTPSDGGNSASDSRCAPSGTRSSTSHGCYPRPIRPRKRHQGNGESEGDEQDVQPRKKLKVSPLCSLEKPRFLACPFWKLDPQQHWECFLRKITTVSYVKQHLNRRHTPALYCPTCFAIFDDYALFDSHILSRSCERDPLGSLDGISTIQSRKLAQKSKGTTEEQWYTIWDILFPSESRPLSIYIDSDQSEDFVGLREFSQREGLSILHDRIRATGQILRPDVSEQAVRDTLRHALDSLFECYRMNEALGRAEPLQTESRTLSDSRPQGVMTDNDSGVMLASHSPHNSHANLAMTAILEDNNGGMPAIEAIDSMVQPQTDRVDPPPRLEAFNTDMPEDWGILGGTESVFESANFDELYNRLFGQSNAAEPNAGLGVDTWTVDGEWRQP